MYICLECVHAQELREIEKAIKDIIGEEAPMRIIGSPYEEVARIEIECTMDAIIDDEQLEQLSEKQKEAIIEDLSQELAMDCEDTVFQELCDRSREILERHSTDNLFDKEYLETVCK